MNALMGFSDLSSTSTVEDKDRSTSAPMTTKQKVVVGLGFVTAIASAATDIQNYIDVSSFDTSMPSWVIVVAVVVALTASQGLLGRILTKEKPEMLPSQELVIDAGIVNRWNGMRKKYGLLGEARADINNFPEELGLIVELDRTYRESFDRKLQKRLRARIASITQMALEPLAVEVQYIAAASDATAKMVMAANADLATELDGVRQAATTAYGEMLLQIRE